MTRRKFTGEVIVRNNASGSGAAATDLRLHSGELNEETNILSLFLANQDGELQPTSIDIDVSSLSGTVPEDFANILSRLDEVGLSQIYQDNHNALYQIVAMNMGFQALYNSGGILPDYPATLEPIIVERTEDSSVAASNRATAMKRLDQMNAFTWEAQSALPGMYGEAPDYDYFFPGDIQTGPAYASVDLVGEGYVGLTCSIETFVTAASNSNSIFYDDYWAYPGWVSVRSSGPVNMGSVCSTIYARAVEWPFAPTTSRLDEDWMQWGFISKTANGTFKAADLQPGDVLNEHGGGHVEIVREVTETTLTLMDQTFGGVDFQDYDIPSGEADSYITRRNYALLVFDYEQDGVEWTYEPEPFAPLYGETFTGVINDQLQIHKGNKTSFNVGDIVHYDILVGSVSELVISKDGVELERVATSGNTRISRNYSDSGDYTAYLEMADTSTSATEEFKVCNVQASLSTNTIGYGGDVHVTFSTENCTPAALLVCRTSDNSTSPLLRRLTAEEIENGRCTFSADLPPTNYYVHIVAQTSFRNDAIYNKPLAALALTVGD